MVRRTIGKHIFLRGVAVKINEYFCFSQEVLLPLLEVLHNAHYLRK